MKLSKKVQQKILKGQKIPLEALEAFERFLNNEIDAKTIKMEYLSDKPSQKTISSLSMRKKELCLSILVNIKIKMK